MTMIIGIYSSDFPRCGDTGEGIFALTMAETLGVPWGYEWEFNWISGTSPLRLSRPSGLHQRGVPPVNIMRKDCKISERNLYKFFGSYKKLIKEAREKEN